MNKLREAQEKLQKFKEWAKPVVLKCIEEDIPFSYSTHYTEESAFDDGTPVERLLLLNSLSIGPTGTTWARSATTFANSNDHSDVEHVLSKYLCNVKEARND